MIKLNGMEIESPSSFTMTLTKLLDSNSSRRVASGKYVKDVIDKKRTITVDWDALKWIDLSQIMNELNEPFISVTYPDSISGILETRMFFVTSRSTPVAFMQNENPYDKTSPVTFYWRGVSVTLEEQ